MEGAATRWRVKATEMIEATYSASRKKAVVGEKSKTLGSKKQQADRRDAELPSLTGGKSPLSPKSSSTE